MKKIIASLAILSSLSVSSLPIYADTNTTTAAQEQNGTMPGQGEEQNGTLPGQDTCPPNTTCNIETPQSVDTPPQNFPIKQSNNAEVKVFKAQVGDKEATIGL